MIFLITPIRVSKHLIARTTHLIQNWNYADLDISDQDHLVDCNTIHNPPCSYFLADLSYALTPKFSPVTIETLHNSTYPYTSDLLSIDNCKPPESTPGIAIEGSTSINTPLIGSSWRTALSHHPDQEYASYIINGILNDFRIGFDHSNLPQSAESNMPSAHTNPAIVVDYMNTEVKEKRVVGPLVRHNSPGVHISRFGVIPKHNQPGKWRLILDLSYPKDRSVNAGISKPLYSLQYASVDDARIITDLGPQTQLAKIDIAHAYRNIPFHPDDRHLLGMEWQNQIFIDKGLPFGLQSAPKIFCSISDALEWILLQKGISSCLHYIDDFLTFGELNSVRAM